MRGHAWLALLLLTAGVPWATAQPAALRAQSAAPMTSKDWNRLRTAAKTPEDFRTCVKWCRLQAGLHQKALGQYEVELRACQARPAIQQGPKYPPTGESLRGQIRYYQGLVEHWTNLAAAYDAMANASAISAPK
jgi:hypothetical protein